MLVKNKFFIDFKRIANNLCDVQNLLAFEHRTGEDLRLLVLSKDCVKLWHLLKAERGGFEPPDACTSHAFQACTIGHSVIFPVKNNAKKHYFMMVSKPKLLFYFSRATASLIRFRASSIISFEVAYDNRI